MSDSTPKVKIAPNSKESEMMVLGCMLTNVNALNVAADALDDNDFYYTEHQIVFQVMKEAYRQDKPADIHIVAEELKRVDKLDAIGGLGYLTTLAQYAGTSAYIEEYAEIVQNKSVLRRMISSAQDVEKNALEDPSDVHSLLDEAQAKFFAISQSANPSTGVNISEIISGARSESKLPYLKELQERQEHFHEHGDEGVEITGIPTDFIDLDNMINGLGPSNLMIIAGRPAMGKTAFAINIAENVCFKRKIPVGIFSLEMSAEQLLHRIICSQSQVESQKILSGSLSGVEYQRVVGAVNMMQEHTMIIDDQPGLRITDLRARARRMKESHDIGLLIIDYLQLLSGSGSRTSNESRQNEISEISRSLKHLARELNIPIICASQLSRKVEERTGHRPMMSDLRESGCLTGDTLIVDADTGERVPIKELSDSKRSINVFGVDENWKVGKHTLTKAFPSGEKEVFELKTRSGRSIKASSNHPFLTIEGWTPLEKLTEKNRIALSRSIEPKKPTSISKDESLLIAHLLGDGCILPNQPYHYTSADSENIEVVGKAVNALFEIQPRKVKQKNWFHLYLPSPTHLTHKKFHPITTWFNKLGIERCHSFEKKVPEAIFQSSDETISHFLHHLWATDGNISEKSLRGRKPSAAIYYASSSPQLAEDVQSLLVRTSVQSTVRLSRSAKGYRPMYHVVIEGKENQLRFLKKIGCHGNRGNIIPKLIENLEKVDTNLNRDVIPKEAWRLFVNPERKASNLTWRQVFSELGLSYSGSILKNGISRSRLKEYNRVIQSKKLDALAHSDVYWDEIVSIKSLGVQPVYDATVETVHNFLANDIFVHNSIEQDSDVVMFLLRREYYDPYDKPGLGEVIVGKNRHGPVGSVNVSYRKELAQFSNYSESASEPDNDEAFAAFSPEP